MVPMTLAEVAAAVDGRVTDAAEGVSAAAQVTSVTVDSRTVRPGGLYVALPGARADGHAFAADAVAAGAVGVLATRPVGVPAVVVADAQAALGRLAAAARNRLTAIVVAVTGSSGKTTTKDLLAHVLGGLGPVVAPPGSYNNEIGLPLTVLSADIETRVLVLELGARGPGHIRALAELARPDVGVVLNVGSAHVGEYADGRAGVAAAKGELAEAVSGTVVLNADDPLVAAMAARTGAAVITYGTGPTADVRAEGIELDATGRASYTLIAGNDRAPVRLRLVGEHQVPNSLAAAAVALRLGMRLPAVADALGTAEPASRWRMAVTDRPDGVTVVNDSYNANPESMRAALKTLAAISRPGGRRSWAVLGQMGELGPDAEREHDDLGRFVVRLNTSRLLVVGPEAGRIHAGAVLEGSWGQESTHVPDQAAALELLRAELRPGDVVLVKASRAAGLEHLAAALIDEVP